MRTTGSFLLLAVACLVSVGTADARHSREPVPCPADVAAAVEAVCPCDGQAETGEPWKSHGRYVRCVARFRNALRRAGCLAADDLREVSRCAARSTCGKANAVVCCLYDGGTCTDPEPGDEVADGFCSNDSQRACDTDDDCSLVHARLMQNEDACYAIDGDALTGSICSACLE